LLIKKDVAVAWLLLSGCCLSQQAVAHKRCCVANSFDVPLSSGETYMATCSVLLRRSIQDYIKIIVIVLSLTEFGELVVLLWLKINTIELGWTAT
jgi:hypothetical protein